VPFAEAVMIVSPLFGRLGNGDRNNRNIRSFGIVGLPN
jgi:hypothetical protein